MGRSEALFAGFSVLPICQFGSSSLGKDIAPGKYRFRFARQHDPDIVAADSKVVFAIGFRAREAGTGRNTPASSTIGTLVAFQARSPAPLPS